MPGIKSILVPVSDESTAASPIETAFLLARAQESHVTVLHVRADATSAVPLVGEGISGAMIEEMIDVAERDARARAARLHAVYQRLRPTAGAGVSVNWREESGREDEIVPLLGRVSDLVVMPGPRPNRDLPSVLTVNGALMESGRPVLMAPPRAPATMGRRILVAWNNSIEAARAVGGALPLLAGAASVAIVVAEADRVAEPDELVAYLGLHGVSAEVRTIATAGARFGQLLLNEAVARSADLIVMGAYTHSRLRQLIMGGVTRHVLEHADVPVLLCH